ncbi:MAG: OB-fold nucleic acid binding domain-containing protein [Candidatus Aenigmarchaeota archaeon]|nr:OB-fold nucleic acid binding domain-containing protein [Candidatus Aenigmarchaeota archaeon]MCX8179451.1 OB-fold nucleic acid binding domain-containing protein [Candidatus Aenigmarchaeota archaeon]
MEVKRMVAVKANISDILNSTFIKKDGLEPSYVLTNIGMKIGKVKLIGTVVDKFVSENGNYSTITIDDESGNIRVKVFREDVSILDNIEIGDMVVVVGKIKQYADEIYVIPNFVRKVLDPNVFTLHKLEVLKEFCEQKSIFDLVYNQKDNFADLEELKNFMLKEYLIEEERISSIIELMSVKDKKFEKEYKSLIIEKIKELDAGKGVELARLAQEVSVPIEILSSTINELLEEGTCYEPLPGLIKLV